MLSTLIYLMLQSRSAAGALSSEPGFVNSREQVTTVSRGVTPSATSQVPATALAAPFYGQSDTSAVGTVGVVDKAKDVSDYTAARTTGGHFAGESCSPRLWSSPF